MGKFEVSCTEGCSCEPLIVNGHDSSVHWSQMLQQKLNITAAGGGTPCLKAFPSGCCCIRIFDACRLDVDLLSSCFAAAESCHLKLIVLDGTDSGEHKVKLMGVMLSQEQIAMFSEVSCPACALTSHSPARTNIQCRHADGCCLFLSCRNR